MNISVIVPLYNEEESLPELYAWIDRVMKSKGFSYEVIFVNDGSTDRSWDVIRELSEKSENTERSVGESEAAESGEESAGDPDR